jgi:hypothetical protein
MSGFFVRRGLRPALISFLTAPSAAHGHIKWFAEVDVSGDPRVPWDVMLAPSFGALALLAMAVLCIAGWLDARLSRGGPFARLGDHGSTAAAAHTPLTMRAGMAACFIANIVYFADAPVFLTPELRSNSAWIVIVQALIALTALFNRPRVAALGILVIWGLAAAQYGLFHLADYPLFLGISAFLALAGTSSAHSRPDYHLLTRGPGLGALVLRVCVALTFMWGATEKWVYPQWTYPLLCGSGKTLLMGLSPDFFMQAAGFIEFTLGFMLLAGGIAARVACGVLIALVVAAIPMFGAVDAIGHAPFALALCVLALLPNPLAARFRHQRADAPGLRWAAAYVVALGTLPLLYFVGHQVAYGRLRSIALPVPVGLETGLLGLLLGWLAGTAVSSRRAGAG